MLRARREKEDVVHGHGYGVVGRGRELDEEETTVMVGPTLLGEMQLPLHLRGEGVFLMATKRREGY
jgi:ketol-acid reductoisomerase